jgi:hypothetical protein
MSVPVVYLQSPQGDEIKEVQATEIAWQTSMN